MNCSTSGTLRFVFLLGGLVLLGNGETKVVKSPNDTPRDGAGSESVGKWGDMKVTLHSQSEKRMGRQDGATVRNPGWGWGGGGGGINCYYCNVYVGSRGGGGGGGGGWEAETCPGFCTVADDCYKCKGPGTTCGLDMFGRYQCMAPK